LPFLPPGMDDEVDVGGGNRWYRSWSREELLAPIPPAPEFEDPVVARAAQLCFAILVGLGSQEIRTSWTDDEHGKLETRMTDIANKPGSIDCSRMRQHSSKQMRSAAT